MARQLRFDLATKPALGREDFFVSPANEVAVASIEAWDIWPDLKLVLTGPAGSGKTHLAHVWANLTGARILRASALRSDGLADLARGPVAVEDIPAIAGQPEAETALFHLHNLMRAERQPLLLTARAPAPQWPLTLPDLASRMQATHQVALGAPDDALLAAVLMKLFADRQINPAPGTLDYLLAQIDRSFAAARGAVRALDEAAMDRGRAVNKSLAIALKSEGKLDFPAPPG
ncbi:chromosomal replication initiator DnaA [Poseidonocella sedimentorum]|uniref:DnaA protein n=1 Tax=Poseidonocella sedimentorum TaxID=871652 RepID=A0A1I6EAU5_9RHOB|nr:chromosomal replication initiator DnaA [Poseidonocella sedimentorum]SFR14835.1 hypothetical protein SAMN04515673_10941 [Poseidonocella sedimentorum]